MLWGKKKDDMPKVLQDQHKHDALAKMLQEQPKDDALKMLQGQL